MAHIRDDAQDLLDHGDDATAVTVALRSIDPPPSGGVAMRLVSRLFIAIGFTAVMVSTTPVLALAQGSPTGTLTGTVSDPSGAVLPGVTVVAKGRRPG